MLRWLSLAGLLLAGCVESLSPLDAGVGPDATTTDAGLTDGALEVDAGAVIATLSIVHANGEAAGGSLVYELNERQGRLLGRADELGQFALRTMPERLLVRHAFDEVQIFSPSFEEQTVTLDVVTDHPETLDLRGVGLESRLFLGTDNVLVAGERLFSVRRDDNTALVLEMDPGTGTERQIYAFESDPRVRNLTTVLRWLGAEYLLVMHNLGTDVLNDWAVRIAVIDLDRELVIGPTDWTSGFPDSVVALRRGDRLEVVVKGVVTGSLELTHHRFLLREGTVQQGQLQKLGEEWGCRLQHDGANIYFQYDRQVLAYNADTATATALRNPEVGTNNCYATWNRQDEGLSTIHIEDDVFVWTTQQGQHLRRPLGWPPSGKASFIGTGNGDGTPFVTNALERAVPHSDDRRGLLVFPNRNQPDVTLLDLEPLYGYQPSLFGPAYLVDGEFVALVSQIDPTQATYDRLFVKRDGRDARKERIELPPRCLILEAGSFVDWPDSITLMNCHVDGFEFALRSHGKDGLRRTFFGGVSEYEEVFKWNGLILFGAGTGDQAGLFAIDPNAPR